MAAAGSISLRPAGVKINICRDGAPRNRKPAGRRQRTNRKKQVLAPTSCLAASLSRPVWQALTQTTSTVELRMQNSSITHGDVEGTVGRLNYLHPFPQFSGMCSLQSGSSWDGPDFRTCLTYLPYQGLVPSPGSTLVCSGRREQEGRRLRR